jgi:hypothetical protein
MSQVRINSKVRRSLLTLDVLGASKTTREIVQFPLNNVIFVGKRDTDRRSVYICIPHATIAGIPGTIKMSAHTGILNRVRNRDNRLRVNNSQ